MRLIPYLFIAALLASPALPGQALAGAPSGRDMILRGNSAASLGKGASGISSQGVEHLHLNPASIASEERAGLGLFYGGPGGDFLYPGLAAAVPTPYGTLGASFRMLSISGDSRNIEKGQLISIGSAKEFTRRLSLGAALEFLHAETSDGAAYCPGLSIGLRYASNLRKSLGLGFGLFDPALGISGRGCLPLGGGGKLADLNSVSCGYHVQFYRHRNAAVSLHNEVSVINGFKEFPVKIGLEATLFDNFIIRSGLMAPPSLRYSAYTLGAGLRFAHSPFEGRLDYAFAFRSDGESGHYLSMTILYGELDREPPLSAITPDVKYLSPNYDGIQDFCTMRISVYDRSRIKGWRLQITAADGSLVRAYAPPGREMRERLTPLSFARMIWQRRESVLVPEKILWDGTDSKGRLLPDGRYSYSFIVWDELDNIAAAKTGTLVIDTTPPSVELKADYLLFSPNGDRQKDTLTIHQEAVTAPDDVWRAGFRDSAGNAVRSYSWTGGALPRRLVWDGKDDSGSEAPEGLYAYFIESSDPAGNKTSKSVREISLTRRYETADVGASVQYFSRPVHGELRFFLSLSRTAGLEDWRLVVEGKDGKPVWETAGGSEFRTLISWDGRDAKGKPLDDGRYFYRLETRFANGNTPRSFTKEIVFDSTPPDLSIDFTPSPFSPDGDGENDTLRLFPRASEEFGLAWWVLTISAPSGSAFKSFSGKASVAGEILWDGTGTDGELVESAADYYLKLEASDAAGNLASTKKKKLPIDVLVLVTERGLKIRISNIEFAFASAKLTRKAYPVLDRVAELLEKYRSYDVLIEGHTDDIGEEEYNLRLSEERSKSVMDYLISEGVSKERLSFRGMGESSPFLPNTGEENRRRNRRVEFLLIKKDLHEEH